MWFMKIKWSDVIESNSEKEYLKIRWSGKDFKKKKTIIELRTELWKKEAIYLKIGGSDFQAGTKMMK